MAYIITQENYNTSISFDRLSVGKMSQSVVFTKQFTLESIEFLFEKIEVDLINDIRFKCIVVNAIGDNNLLPSWGHFVTESTWIEDSNLIENDFNSFEFPEQDNPFDPGVYYFSIFPDMQTSSLISLRIQNTGLFNGKFINLINSTGIYYDTKSLAYKISGKFGLPGTVSSSLNNQTFEDIYMTSTIRDMTS